MANPVRFTSGVATAALGSTLDNYLAPDPTKVIAYFNDFFVYAAGDWTVTGSPTNALADMLGGGLSITAANTTNDTLSQIQQSKEAFIVQSGKKAWFKARFKLASGTNGDCICGIYVADTSPIASAPSDGIWFRKDDGDTNIDFVVRVDAADAVAASAVGTMADDTFVTVGFYYDGAATIYAYVADVLVGSYSLTAAQLAALDDETLAIAFAHQNANNTTALAGTVDYLFAAVER